MHWHESTSASQLESPDERRAAVPQCRHDQGRLVVNITVASTS